MQKLLHQPLRQRKTIPAAHVMLFLKHLLISPQQTSPKFVNELQSLKAKQYPPTSTSKQSTTSVNPSPPSEAVSQVTTPPSVRVLNLLLDEAIVLLTGD